MPAPEGAPASPMEPEAERWRITDDRAAEWVLRKYAAAARRLGELDQELAQYRSDLEAWWRDSGHGERQTVQWAEALLARYATEAREADPDAKTLRLPSGQVKTRQLAAKVTVTDPGAVAAVLAKVLPDAAYEQVVQHRVTVSVQELAKHVQVADEWELRLACGCAPIIWQLDARMEIERGAPWPYRDGDHANPNCPRRSDRRTTEVVEVEARRQNALVVVVPDAEGIKRVHVVEGAYAEPGRLSVTVQPS